MQIKATVDTGTRSDIRQYVHIYDGAVHICSICIEQLDGETSAIVQPMKLDNVIVKVGL